MSLLARVRLSVQKTATAHIGKHARLYTNLFFVLAIAYTLCWPAPFISRNTYYSENALNVGAATERFDSNDARFALNISRSYCQDRTPVDFVLQQLRSFGFHAATGKDSQLLWALFRAPKGNGKESVAFSAALTTQRCDNVGLVLAVLRLLSQEKYLHHDILFIGHRGQLQPQEQFNDSQLEELKEWGGQIRESFHLDFSNFAVPFGFKLAVLSEGFNGEQPNLDLVNVVTGFAERNGMHVSLHALHSVDYPLYQKIVKWLGARGWDLSTLILYYTNLLRGMGKLIVSVPTGLHGKFRTRMIHSLTLCNTQDQQNQSSVASTDLAYVKERNIERLGQVIEGTFRSMNNLLEQLHQSFFIYFMLSEKRFVGFEDFIPTLLLFIAPFLVQVTSNYYLTGKHKFSVLLNEAASVSFGLLLGLLCLILPSALDVTFPIGQGYDLLFWFGCLGLLVVSSGQFFLTWTRTAMRRRDEKALHLTFSCLLAMIGSASFIAYHSALMISLSVYCFVVVVWIGGLSKETRRERGTGCFTLVQLSLAVAASPFLVAYVLLYLANAEHSLVWEQMNIARNSNSLFLAMCLVVVPTWFNVVNNIIC